jgi:hypothetical protein
VTEELRIQEATYQNTSVRHDPEKSIVYGVKLVSWGESFHKRVYESCCGADVNKFHGAKSNIDHQPDPNGARYGVRFGRVFNPVVKGDGIYGDFKYNPKHSAAESFVWWVDNDPAAIGFSIDAMSKIERLRDGRLAVKGFTKVNSVDVVGDPASTKGVFESRMNQEPATPEGGAPDDSEMNLDVDEAAATPDDLKDTGCDEELGALMSAVFMNSDTLDKVKLARTLRSVADLLEDMDGGDGESEEYEDESTEGEAPQEEETKMQESTIKELTAKVEKLTADLTEARLQESKRAEFEARKVAMRKRCTEAKLAETAISDVFVENLAAQDSEEVVTRLLEDRVSLTKGTKITGVQPVSVGAISDKLSDEQMEKFLLTGGVK